MKISELCNNAITITQDQTLYDAACLMEENNVGSVVVTGEDKDAKPVGMITDRDLVIRGIADNKDLKETKVSEIMSENLLFLESQKGIKEAIDEMNEKGVRRAPVLNNEKLCGVVAVDDLIELLAKELNSLAGLVKKQMTT